LHTSAFTFAHLFHCLDYDHHDFIRTSNLIQGTLILASQDASHLLRYSQIDPRPHLATTRRPGRKGLRQGSYHQHSLDPAIMGPGHDTRSMCHILLLTMAWVSGLIKWIDWSPCLLRCRTFPPRSMGRSISLEAAIHLQALSTCTIISHYLPPLPHVFSKKKLKLRKFVHLKKLNFDISLKNERTHKQDQWMINFQQYYRDICMHIMHRFSFLYHDQITGPWSFNWNIHISWVS